MKLFKMLVMALGFTAASAFAQDVPVEDLPVATIDDNFYVTVPDSPISDYYYIDISHLEFADEQEAIYLLGAYVTGNLITNEVFYADNYMIVNIHLEYVGDDFSTTDLQSYLGELSKPPVTD